jgi:hypothetical protein
MDFTTMLLVMVLLWFVYMLLQSYRNLEKELREIRVKCVMPAATTQEDPVNTMKQTVVAGLSRLASTI